MTNPPLTRFDMACNAASAGGPSTIVAIASNVTMFIMISGNRSSQLFFSARPITRNAPMQEIVASACGLRLRVVHHFATDALARMHR